MAVSQDMKQKRKVSLKLRETKNISPVTAPLKDETDDSTVRKPGKRKNIGLKSEEANDGDNTIVLKKKKSMQHSNELSDETEGSHSKKKKKKRTAFANLDYTSEPVSVPLKVKKSKTADVSSGEHDDYRAVPPPAEKSNWEPKQKKGPPVIKPKDAEMETRTIFVGNVPLKVNRRKMNKVFAKFGAVESVRLRSVPRLDAKKPIRMSAITHRWNENRSSQNAYIRFKTEEDAQKAVAEADGMMFQEHHLRVNMALSDQRPDPRRAVFVGGLPMNAEDNQLWQLFENCGTIATVRVVRDATTSIGKGFGYVNFSDEEAVARALKLNGSELDGQAIRVQRCRATAHKKIDMITGKKLRKVGEGADGESKRKVMQKIAPVNKFSGDAVAESKPAQKKKKKMERWDDAKKAQRKLVQSLNNTMKSTKAPKSVNPSLVSFDNGIAPQNKVIKFDFGEDDTPTPNKGTEKLKKIKAKKEARRKKKHKSLEQKSKKAIAEPLSQLLPK